MAKPKKCYEKIIVTFYVQRHGEKGPGPNDLAELTEKGITDVMTSMANNMRGVTLDRAYFSLKFRTLQTVFCSILSLFRIGTFSLTNRFQMEAREGFDYTSAPDLGRYMEFDACVKSIAKERMVPITVSLWQEVAPAMINHLTAKVTEELKKIAWEIGFNRKTTDKKEYSVLVGCHSPVSELATLTPKSTPMLREGDIMKYTVEVEKLDDVAPDEIFRPTIISSEYIPRGF